MKWASRILIGLATCSLIAAIYFGVSNYREAVKMRRFAHGPDATVPLFENLFGIDSLSWYILAIALGVPGVVCLILSVRSARTQSAK